MNYRNLNPIAGFHISEASDPDSGRLTAAPRKSDSSLQELQSNLSATLTEEDCTEQLLNNTDHGYPALAIALAAQSTHSCTYSTLVGALKELDLMLPQLKLEVEQLTCRRWKKQLHSELDRRHDRYEYFSLQLSQNLQLIRSLNADLYDRVFANVNFDPWLDCVLDGDETSLNETLRYYHSEIRGFYSELTLRRLAPLVCQMRRTTRQVRRLELIYEYCPVVSLAIVTIVLRFWMIWTWAFIAAVFIVSPMMIWVAHPKRCEVRSWAAQTNLRQRNNLSQDWCDLREQEAQVLSLLMI